MGDKELDALRQQRLAEMESQFVSRKYKKRTFLLHMTSYNIYTYMQNIEFASKLYILILAYAMKNPKLHMKII